MLLAVATLALGGALWLALRRAEPTGPFALLITAACWLAVNEPVEGPVIVRISSGHGVHLADMLVIAVVAAAMAVRPPFARSAVEPPA